MREYLQVHDPRQGAQQGGLAEARDAFEQDVPAGHQTDQNAVNDIPLADDHFRDFVAYLGE